jgi:hypothetical protein
MQKAGIVAFCIMIFHFFFGSIHDTLKNYFPGTIITRYSFLFFISLFIFLFIIIAVKKRKQPLNRISIYLNLMLSLLITIDSVWLFSKIPAQQKKTIATLSQEFIACDTCGKPDIYLIITDEYAGNKELKDLFQFDNSAFLKELSNRGFHTIPFSFSNYNYTPFSIASTLDMNYLNLTSKERNKQAVTYCYETIRDNRFLQFLQYHQYKFYNYSFFDFKGQPARTAEVFLPSKTRLITSQTFLSRFDRDIRFNLITRLKSKKELKRHTYANKTNNANLYRLTEKVSEQKTVTPKFVFTHLMIPHYPYYFDKNGEELPFEKIVEGNQSNKKAYIEYLQWSNKKIVALIDHILLHSPSPPVIIIAGDHGFRHFTSPVDSNYHFMNLMSICLPDKKYTAFPDTLSNVNLLRTFLNNNFRQQLPYHNSRTTYMPY